MAMDIDQRGSMQPQQSYHPHIPPILATQEQQQQQQQQQQQYGQSRYPAPVPASYQAIQPQPSRSDYPSHSQQQQQQQQQSQHQQQQQTHQQQQQQPHHQQSYGYAPPAGSGSGSYPRYGEPTYTAAPPPPGLYGSPDAPSSVPRQYNLPPLDASSPHQASWQQQQQQQQQHHQHHHPHPHHPQQHSQYYHLDNYPITDSRGSANYERVEGKPGYPPRAISRGPKQRFTPEDDDLLRKLKEDFTSPRLSWKQIADFFPDRNSGTLQVRYCTKLKRKDEIRWTEEADRKLIKLYREDREAVWRRVSQKMGTGASEEHCRERYETLSDLQEAMELKRGGYSDGDDVESVRG